MPQALQSPLEWPKEGNARVPYRVFSDPEIFRTERDRVFFGPTWQYLALADELPETGDYKTTFLGETPVIVTRGEDGLRQGAAEAAGAAGHKPDFGHERSPELTGWFICYGHDLTGVKLSGWFGA